MEKRYELLAVCLAPTFQRTLVLERLVPGAVNRAAASYLDAGGKGVHAARAASQAGGRAIHLTHAGGEGLGLWKRLCAEDGIETDIVETEAGIRTCTTLLDRSRGLATELVEECPPVERGVWPRVLERFAALLPGCAVVLYSGKAAPGYPVDCAGTLAELCARAGTPFVIDARGKALLSALPHRPVLAKPNAEEFLATFPPEVGHPEGLEAAAARASAEYGTAFLITRGADDALLASAGACSSIRVRRIEALNPIGSGDSCAAGFCLALAGGKGLAEAAAYGIELGTRNAATIRPGRLR